jgi:hypothetical protein
MPIILNLNTTEYFITNNEQEKTYYLKKLLNHTPPTVSLDWKVNVYNTHTYFKSVIRWDRTDKIIIVPQNTEPFILNTFKYKNISTDYSGNAL